MSQTAPSATDIEAVVTAYQDFVEQVDDTLSEVSMRMEACNYFTTLSGLKTYTDLQVEFDKRVYDQVEKVVDSAIKQVILG